MLVDRSVFPLIVSVLLFASCPAMAQSIAAHESTDTVIHTSANLVLVDVVVTSKGKAVHNLDRSNSTSSRMGTSKPSLPLMNMMAPQRQRRPLDRL